MQAVDKNIPQDLKVRAWVGRHFKQVLLASFFLSGLSLVLLMIVVVKLGNTLNEQAKAIQNLSSRVVVVRADGKVASLETEQLSQDYLVRNLRDILFNYLILSAFDLRDTGGQMEAVVKLRKVERMSQHFSKELGGVEGYRAYLEYLISLFKANNLPEVIWVGDMSAFTDRIRYQDGKFTYAARVPLNTFYARFQQWNAGTGSMEVYAEGLVDISKSTPENPLGIYFTRFEVRTYVGKDTPSTSP